MTDRWWAVEPIMMLPKDGKILLLSPAAAKRLVVDTDIGQLLLAAEHGIAKDRELPGWSGTRYASVTGFLAGHGYLVEDRGAHTVAAPWRHWGLVAWAYHESLVNPSSYLTGVDSGAPTEPPPSFSPAPGEVVPLPRPSGLGQRGFTEVLESRRTHRDFLERGVPAEAFAEILRYTLGPLRTIDTGPLGVLQLRAAASAGARHETDGFVAVLDVSGIEPGLYRYDGARHGLSLVQQGDLRSELEWLTFEQGFFRRAGFGVLTVAVTDRLSWKYRHSSAYRMLWQNCGHLAQVFSMVCASLDLGAALTGAIRDSEARELLGIDNPAEIVTFAMSCGWPVDDPDVLPGADHYAAVAHPADQEAP